jgi:hypothetical protein
VVVGWWVVVRVTFELVVFDDDVARRPIQRLLLQHTTTEQNVALQKLSTTAHKHNPTQPNPTHEHEPEQQPTSRHHPTLINPYLR